MCLQKTSHIYCMQLLHLCFYSKYIAKITVYVFSPAATVRFVPVLLQLRHCLIRFQLNKLESTSELQGHHTKQR